MMKLVEVQGVPNTFYIHKDGKEIGLLVKFDNTGWKMKIHEWVDSMDYHGIWLVTQDKICQEAYYEKERNKKAPVGSIFDK